MVGFLWTHIPCMFMHVYMRFELAEGELAHSFQRHLEE